ncbi:uncharacterized protein [Tursiops truncatus]|uniref:uncharacterized protein n=1 Tax=Tursiops truncatus TaxID=9739 RepID=UPI003CCF5546
MAGPAAPTPPACAEAAPLLGGCPRRLGNAGAAAGREQGRARQGGPLRAGRSGVGWGVSAAGGQRGPRHHSRARRELCRALGVPGVLGVAAAANPTAGDAAAAAAAASALALCIVGAGGGCAPALPPRLLRVLSGSRCLPSAAGTGHHQPVSQRRRCLLPRCRDPEARPRTPTGRTPPPGCPRPQASPGPCRIAQPPRGAAIAVSLRVSR